MGAIVALPLRLASSCLGTCVAFSCVKLADSGSVSTMEAVRCVLAWLQAFGLVLAWAVSSSAPQGWIQSMCRRLDLVGYGDVGVCACLRGADEGLCWSSQLVYRATAATAAVFLALLAFAVSGCATSAARSHETGKFLAVLVLAAAFLAAPNAAFDGFGSVATVLSGLFLLLQSCLVLDFSCTCHELWHDRAQGSSRRSHEAAIVATSATMVIASLVFACFLWQDFPQALARHITCAVEILSFLLLILSITDFCKHGTLFTSSVMMLYNTWLAHEAFVAMCPALAGEHSMEGLLTPCMSMGLCVATLLLLAADAGDAPRASASGEALLPAAGAEAGAGPAAATAALSEEDKASFVLQCAVHSAVPFYVASVLVPTGNQRSCVAFVVRAVVVHVSLLLYSWHLVAPKLLTSREF